MEFEKACSEIVFVIDNLELSEKEKIPQNVKEFFLTHRDPLYKVNLDVTQKLYDQELLDETKVFLQILKFKYFSTEEEQIEFKEILNEFEEKYDIENFKFEQKNTEDVVSDEQNQMVVYKENWIKKLFNKITGIFQKVTNFTR